MRCSGVRLLMSRELAAVRIEYAGRQLLRGGEGVCGGRSWRRRRCSRAGGEARAEMFQQIACWKELKNTDDARRSSTRILLYDTGYFDYCSGLPSGKRAYFQSETAGGKGGAVRADQPQRALRLHFIYRSDEEKQSLDRRGEGTSAKMRTSCA